MTDLLKPIVSSLLLDYRQSGDSGALELSAEMIADLAAYCAQAGIREVSTSTNGQTTSSPSWHEALAPLLDAASITLQIQSNFARELSDAELAALNKHQRVGVDIDSSVPADIKAWHKIDMRSILSNAIRLKHLTMKTGKTTKLEITCRVSRKNVGQILDVAKLALVLKADVLILTDLTVDGDNAGVSGGVAEFTDQEAGELVKAMIAAVQALAGSTTELRVRPEFAGKLQPILTAINEQRPVSAESLRANAVGGDTPGPCMQPWQTVFVAATGDVRTCAGQRASLGNIGDVTLAGIVDGPSARDIRAKILNGESDLPCATCSYAQTAPAAAFNAFVARSIEEYDAARAVSSV